MCDAKIPSEHQMLVDDVLLSRLFLPGMLNPLAVQQNQGIAIVVCSWTCLQDC